MALNLDDLYQLLMRRGSSQYGMEAVSQLDHALQCAQLAETACETPETVTACLLHDLGHLLAAELKDRKDQETNQATGDRDHLHQYLALPFLRERMPEAVLEPIRLHVDAKRYLCQAEVGYFASLSPASVRSLAQQGGSSTAWRLELLWRSPMPLRLFVYAATTISPRYPASRCPA